MCYSDCARGKVGISAARIIIDIGREDRQRFSRGALIADTPLLFDALIWVLVLLITGRSGPRSGRCDTRRSRSRSS